MFTFILFANLIGLVPGFTAPTGNIGTTFGLGIVSFVAYNYYGFREHGVSYLKHFAGPVIWLAPLMAVVEVLSHVFRPVSLAIRLFGNMFADHLVLGIFTDLTKAGDPDRLLHARRVRVRRAGVRVHDPQHGLHRVGSRDTTTDAARESEPKGGTANGGGERKEKAGGKPLDGKEERDAHSHHVSGGLLSLPDRKSCAGGGGRGGRRGSTGGLIALGAGIGMGLGGVRRRARTRARYGGSHGEHRAESELGRSGCSRRSSSASR